MGLRLAAGLGAIPAGRDLRAVLKLIARTRRPEHKQRTARDLEHLTQLIRSADRPVREVKQDRLHIHARQGRQCAVEVGKGM